MLACNVGAQYIPKKPQRASLLEHNKERKNTGFSMYLSVW